MSIIPQNIKINWKKKNLLHSLTVLCISDPPASLQYNCFKVQIRLKHFSHWRIYGWNYTSGIAFKRPQETKTREGVDEARLAECYDWSWAAATRGSLYYLLLLISSVFAITLNVLKCKFLSLSPTGLEKFLSLSEELACTALHPGHLSCKARGRSFLGSLQEWFWRVLCRCLRCSIFLCAI